MHINFINDRKYLGFMCLKDKEAGDQVTVILVIGIIGIKIYLNPIWSVNDQDLVDRSYSTRPSCERILKSRSSNSTQQVEQVHNYVEEEILVTNTDGKVIKTGSGILIGNQPISEGSKSALTIRSGDLGKSGPGARAKADARRNAKSSGSTIIPGANGFVPHQTYCRYHDNAPLSCKPRVKLSNQPFQGDGDNNFPPPEDSQFDASKYKGGPSPFEEYEYKDPAVVAQNIGFNQPNRLNKSYDKHAEDCFGIVENRNKENLEIFKGDIKNLAQSADEVYKGSYRYEDPAYIFLLIFF